MKATPLLVLSLTAALLLPAALQAAEPKANRPGRGYPEQRLKLMTEKLGLTEEQQTKVKEIFAKNGPEMRDLMAKGRENLTDDDKKKLRELVKAQMEEVAGILTPEQKEKMKELRKERAGAGGRRGKSAA